ncbi:ABC transporter substrate-binding protein [Arthrobacter bambusae]|uniref:ABC transporter substrate-binding protein n=1 Tax=Arthrobacter bambusae TaxID=1338426 RepID=UPI0027803BFD|nr:ABC transporter substrate-binding protein [Arthrobacter bambusae]MDQ0029916.1 polar amino acid transport system substrate-binding protein [Arthrobacter bambusae]MDQ0097566.1 polar amino acid transport system substrate-binding protein [Arthrobacter bambusae]
MTDRLTLACIDSEAPPLFHASPDGIRRAGYEPEAAELIARELGREVDWLITSWTEMIPKVQSGEADAVWCGQGITAERQAQVDFSVPYAIFNETVLVRAGDTARAPEDLAGYRVAAIANSTNMALAETFPGIETVSFGASDDVFADMLDALRNGTVDAVVDDDVVTVPLGADPDFDIAFTAPTGNRWGVGVAKGNSELLQQLDQALATVIADGRLEAIWSRWMPDLGFPLNTPQEGR